MVTESSNVTCGRGAGSWFVRALARIVVASSRASASLTRVALPIVILVVIQLSFAFSREREEVERRTLSNAQQIVELVDAR